MKSEGDPEEGVMYMDEVSVNHGIAVRKKILEFVISYITEHGYSPSVREIGDAVGLKSTSSVHSHLDRMFRSGELETDAKLGTPRAIRVPGFRFMREEKEDVKRSIFKTGS